MNAPIAPIGPGANGPAPFAPGHSRTGVIATGFRWRSPWLTRTALPLAGVTTVAILLRFWQLDAVGFNSDEAVYAGTAAAIAGDSGRAEMFPVFRAHPILFQSLLSIVFQVGVTDWAGRALAATIGVGAVVLTFLLARRLYGRRAGLIAALLLAVMPYHVIVSRQVLLDGLMTLCATATVYCVVRYGETIAWKWLLAAGAMMGLTVLAKETSLVLLGGLYTFFALTPVVRLRVAHLFGALATMGALVLVMPVVAIVSGRGQTAGNYLVWQLFRRANHETHFYFRVLPMAIGVAVLIAAVAGLIWLRRENTWRERLALSWIGVAVVFFTLWPVKGYQYLLPAAPIVAALAGRTLARLGELSPFRRPGRLPRLAPSAVVALVVLSLAVPAWRVVDPSASTGGVFLAGTGGLPGGREAGRWVAENVPPGGRLLALGPSMANVVQFYSGRRVYALSVSPNPLARNPSYVPVANPDRALRDGELQYVVWDSYTAARARFFADKLRALVDKYRGVAIFTATTQTVTASGARVSQPVIIIYKVRAL